MLQARLLDREDAGVSGRVSRKGGYGPTGQVSR